MYIQHIMKPVQESLNPIREIGALAHKYGAIFTVDTTSTYAMRPINIEEDNIDFCMASAQKGLMAFTGLSVSLSETEQSSKSQRLSETFLLLQSLSSV